MGRKRKDAAARKRRAVDAVVIARCIGCSTEREVWSGEIPPGEMPVCEKCFMPMIAVGAKVKVTET